MQMYKHFVYARLWAINRRQKLCNSLSHIQEFTPVPPNTTINHKPSHFELNRLEGFCPRSDEVFGVHLDTAMHTRTLPKTMMKMRMASSTA